ncbi:response regulator [Paenibacillus radicis (ex Xue et al. 2023)]|uniref:Response regulator n=1 Tax=Paenibacillus radicis (ex Xue et al. 2023) TaxID=2972489 RepID=A0ABT1YUA5_9BACL|nr:response regulator [Paenibacillus radicis (ex Xue et al. 2023)]MCR8635923.1 response regulator [Paenibacillus radicis (ex Xue et al. 2023)]
MKIIVIEDEVDILLGIQEVIEQSGLSFEQVFAEHSGEEALTLIERYRPEIILTDILLPEMSGLDMLESVKAMDYQPKVIVISSYSNFTYAQRSIQLGAVDYILKPTLKEELIDKIRSVYDMVQRERTSQDQIRNQMAYARLGTEALREKFVQGLCMHKTALQEHIHHRLQVWDLQWLETQSYVVISLSINKDEFRGKEDKDINLDLFAIGNIAEDIMKNYQSSVMIRSIYHDWVILTAWEEEWSIAQDIYERALAYQKIRPAIGISERKYSFQAISEAYEQARKALKIALLNNSKRIVRYVEIADRIDEQDDVRIGQRVAEAVLNGDESAVKQGLDKVIERFILDRDVSKTGDLSIKCFEWILEVHSILAEKVDMEISHFPMELWEKAERCPTMDDLTDLLFGHLCELMKLAVDPQQPPHPHYLIDKVKRIIEMKYGEEVTLQTVADELSIHPVWLSRLFKKETGQNFLDYLTEIRIEQAKQLLRSTNLKIYEIAEKIGYQEIQYFGKLFKKRTNMTPKEFRYGK